MPLTACQDCSNPISTDAAACPKCGKPVQHIGPISLLTAFAALLKFGLFLFIAGVVAVTVFGIPAYIAWLCGIGVLLLVFFAATKPTMQNALKISLCVLGIYASFAFFHWLRQPSPLPTPQLDLSKAAGYALIKKEDGPRFHSATIFIDSPGTTDFETRAQTAMKAALDFSGQYQLDETEVLLVENSRIAQGGNQYARVRYLTDKGKLSPQEDTWDVTSSEDVFAEKDIRLIELWCANKDRFLTKKGFVDNDRFNAFIAKQAGIKPEDVDLPGAIYAIYTPKYK